MADTGNTSIMTQWESDEALTSLAQIVQQGYQLVTVNRYPPSESTSGTYETAYYLQKGGSLVVCFEEFSLDQVGPNARFTGSRFACFKVVNPRPFRKRVAGAPFGEELGNR